MPSLQRRSLLLSTTASLLAGLGTRAEAAPPASERLRRSAEAAAASGGFMGAVLLAEGDRLLLDRGFGPANVEWRQANSPRTRFRIGSVSKQFTAVAVLQLQERGKFKLDDAVGRHLAGLPPAWQGLTLRQLLNHTAGVPDFTDLPSYPQLQRQSLKPAEVLASVSELPLAFKPGERHAYSNSGYVLLGQLLEAVSGQNYADLLDALLFKPLGLQDSCVDRGGAVLSRRASGYAPVAGRPGELAQAEFIDMSIPHAAGALVSTTHDLWHWQQALYGGRVLAPASLAEMTTPALGGYGLGIGVQSRAGGRVMAHGGGIDGFSAWLEYRESSRRSVVVLSNLDGEQAPQLAARLTVALDGLPPLGDVALYLRGSMNEWGLNHPLTAAGPLRWAAELALPAGRHEFKLASQDWRRLDLGAAGKAQATPGQALELMPRGSNLQLELPEAGRWRFMLDLTDRFAPRVTVSPLR